MQKFREKEVNKLYIGDFEEKVGIVRIVVEDNLLPSVKTNGFIRIENDDNTLNIDNKKVTKLLFEEKFSEADLAFNEKGSIASAVLIGDDFSEVYVFDENRNLRILSSYNF